jgi:hypothetical protein
VGNGCPVGDPDSPEDCSETKTASTCITTTTSSILPSATAWTTWSFSECVTNIGCSVTDSSSSTTKTGTEALPTIAPVHTDFYGLAPVGIPIDTAKYYSMGGAPVTSATTQQTTPAPTQQTTTAAPPPSTEFITCSHHNQDPGQGITKAFCVCSGSTFPEVLATQVTPYNSCGYTVMPTITLGGNTLPASTNTADCSVCTVVGGNNNVCTSLANCTPQPTTTVVAPPATTPCVEIILDRNDFLETVWWGEILVDKVRVCYASTNGISNTGTIPCTGGYTLRYSQNNQNARDSVVELWYSTPTSGGEMNWTIDEYDESSQSCGGAVPITCHHYWYYGSLDNCGTKPASVAKLRRGMEVGSFDLDG